ncbi:MAG: hypothetical protein WAV56_02385 [Microgenomates group bacterium]
MTAKVEIQKRKGKFQIETEIKPEKAKIAETLGKFTKMLAKNGAGDKSGIYGH